MTGTVLALSVMLASAATPEAQQDVVYDFYADWCGPCLEVMPLVDKLQAEGLPIQKVNFDQRRDLVQRFGVTRIPSFVLVVGGEKRQHYLGPQSEETLRALLAQVPQRQPRAQSRSGEIQLVGSDLSPQKLRGGRATAVGGEKKKSGLANWLLPPLPPFMQKKREGANVALTRQGADSKLNARIESTPPKSDKPETKPDSTDDSRAEADASTLLAASTRIRVTDDEGTNFGSGVLIENRKGGAAVLTCGHILRGVKEGTRIEVDLFDGKSVTTCNGKLIDSDLKADVGLIEIQAEPGAKLHFATVAALASSAKRDESVMSVGCSGGEPPTLERVKVTSLNRYYGPDNIECTGVPVQGRSGGGLFNAAGEIVGICVAADPREGRGVYAGLKPVYALLQRANLHDPTPESEPGENVPAQLAAAGSNRRSAAAARGSASAEELLDASDAFSRKKANTRPSRLREQEPDREVIPVSGRRSLESSEASARTPITPRSHTEQSLSEQLDAEDSEVICIIRPLGKPKSASRVVIINRASPKFMSYLDDEVNEQLQPTMRKIPSDPAAGCAVAGEFNPFTPIDTEPFEDALDRPVVVDPASGFKTHIPRRYVRSPQSHR